MLLGRVQQTQGLPHNMLAQYNAETWEVMGHSPQALRHTQLALASPASHAGVAAQLRADAWDLWSDKPAVNTRTSFGVTACQT